MHAVSIKVPRTRCPRRGAHARRAPRAFTLLELLMVTALIAVLASITLVVGRSVSERSKVAQARAEMAVLAAALEQYKQHYGDYPWTPATPPEGMASPPWDGGAVLFNALCGNLGPNGTVLSQKGRVFVDVARFTVDRIEAADLPDPDDPSPRMNWFNDPWGQWYYYHYKKSPSDADWKSKGFLLYSHGPDGLCNVGDAEDSGLLEDLPGDGDNIARNRDNIYYGRE